MTHVAPRDAHAPSPRVGRGRSQTAGRGRSQSVQLTARRRWRCHVTEHTFPCHQLVGRLLSNNDGSGQFFCQTKRFVHATPGGRTLFCPAQCPFVNGNEPDSSVQLFSTKYSFSKPKQDSFSFSCCDTQHTCWNSVLQVKVCWSPHLLPYPRPRIQTQPGEQPPSVT